MAEIDTLPPLRNIGDHRNGHIVVGSEVLKLVNLTRLNRVAQARQRYREEDMDELVESLVFPLPDGRNGIKLVQSPTVVYFPEREARAYVRKANQMFDANFNPDDLVPIEDGANGFIIVLAGHRRTYALEIVAPQVDMTPEQIDVVCQVEPSDLTFRNAIALQYRENLHRRLPPHEDAFVINAFLEEGRKEGEYEGFADCARGLGVRAERVSRAFRYQTLPAPIREMVQEKILHFERAITLSRLCVVLAFQELDDEKKNEFKQKLVTKTLYLPDIHPYLSRRTRTSLKRAYISHALQLIDLDSNGAAKAYVTNTIEAIQNDGQIGFIVLTEEEIENERDRQERDAGLSLAARVGRAQEALLRSDAQRIRDGRRPVYEGSRTAKRLLVVRAAIAAAGSKDLEKKARLKIINDGEQAARELAEEAERERTQGDQAVDSFTAATTDNEPMF